MWGVGSPATQGSAHIYLIEVPITAIELNIYLFINWFGAKSILPFIYFWRVVYTQIYFK